MLVFVEYAAESVSSADVELVESVWSGDWLGRWPEGRAVQGAVRSVLVVVEGATVMPRVMSSPWMRR
jgi:hypothetical protein